MKKAFYIDLYNVDTYPTRDEIIDTVIKDQRDVEFIKNISFVNKKDPVVFKLKDGIFEVEVKRVRGWFTLYCKEV